MKTRTTLLMFAIAFALIGWLLPSQGLAYDVKVDDIYYNLNQEEMTAEVTYATSSMVSIDYIDDVTIPSSFEYQGTTYKVSSIGNFAFANCMKLNAVTIPNGVVSISNYAFMDCSSLASLFIPVSVTHIGRGICRGCTYLESIVVDPDNEIYNSANGSNVIVETSTNALIAGCRNSVIPDGVKIIAEESFTGCQSLTSIVIPDGVERIEDRAFAGCGRLSCPISIPNSVTTIGKKAFYGCPITELTLGSGLKEISREAFAYTQITSLTIPEGVNQINAGTFMGNALLATVEFADNVTAIGDSAFYRCNNLAYIDIPGTISVIGEDAFAGCKLAELTIGNGLKEIGKGAFAYCTFSSLRIPKSVERIGHFPFYNCHNMTVVILDCDLGQIELGDALFYGTQLKEVYSNVEQPHEIDTSNIFGLVDWTTLYVPKGSLEAYKTTGGWQDFRNIMEYDYNSIRLRSQEVPASSDAYYDLQGRRQTDTRRGISIIRQADGSTRKVLR